jgi:hypothetical protein
MLAECNCTNIPAGMSTSGNPLSWQMQNYKYHGQILQTNQYTHEFRVSNTHLTITCAQFHQIHAISN